jgi:excisionase family DNA binding protein
MATPEELADYLNLPLNTIYDWRRRGTGPKGIRAGRHIRYPWSEIDAWVASQKEVAA